MNCSIAEPWSQPVTLFLRNAKCSLERYVLGFLQLQLDKVNEKLRTTLNLRLKFMYFDACSSFGVAATGRAVWRAKVDVPGAGDWTLPWILVGVYRLRLAVDHR